MPNAEIIKQRITERIHESGLQLTVHYPANRPAATGTAPGPSLASPLTGPVVTTTVIPSAVTPSKSPVTVDCLWQQTYGSVATSVHKDEINRLPVAWLEGASVLASVTMEDAAVDSADPFGDTIFTDAAYIEFSGRRFTILSVQPIGPSFTLPYVYYVWLTGAAKQA